MNLPTLDLSTENLTACPDCDLLQHIPPLKGSQKARCPRCGALFRSDRAEHWQRTLALALAAAIMFVVAHSIPLMGLSVVGRLNEATMIDGIIEMWSLGEHITATIVAFCVLIAPAIQIGFILVILITARRESVPAWVGSLLRLWDFSRIWSMSEVMLLGILVALVKLSQIATILPNIGFYATGILVFLLAAMITSFESASIWSRITWHNGTRNGDTCRLP
ncbi:paraquat-inducible protein A [Chrysiogenes arsenatis]|uniref:paraquat-inducible protein A n=1 Tax=Chrysiogenes arsenatis TaxID=309797 RepID=UPI0003F58E25|nr:paraquat-inducible protein A [Chrysiogenes arsenatis]